MMKNAIKPNLDILVDFRYISQGERFKIGLISIWLQFKYSWGIFSRNRLALLGMALLLIYLFMAMIHPILLRTVWPKGVYDPVVGFDMNLTINPAPPDLKHPLGTDTLGRDVLSMLMAATAPSLVMAITSALIAAFIGTLVGAISAYFRGFVDGFFSHLADLTLLMPAPLVMVIIGFTLDISPFEFGLIYGILVGLSVIAIVLRAHAMTIANRTFIDAARTAGGGSLHIIFKHLVPHLIPLAAVNMLLTVTGAIFASGFIAFLGLSRAHLNWGSMIYDSFTYQGINGVIPWNVMVPSALAISLFAASFYLIALGLQDVTNPRLAERFVTGVSLPVQAEKEKIPKVPFKPVSLKPMTQGSTSQGQSSIVDALHGTVTFQFSETGSTTALVDTRPISKLYGRCISVLVLNISGDSLEIGNDYTELVTSINNDLVCDRGLVKQIKDDLWVASFGFLVVIPPQANALMASTIGLKVKQTIGEFNRRRISDGSNMIKLNMGISIGKINFHLAKEADWYASVLGTEVGHIASKLCSLAGFMREGGVLICENTFNNLVAVQHHFVFGRQGLVKLPPEENQKMVYELVSQQIYLRTNLI
jgi:peptide/nickel transport system permease protein